MGVTFSLFWRVCFANSATGQVSSCAGIQAAIGLYEEGVETGLFKNFGEDDLARYVNTVYPFVLHGCPLSLPSRESGGQEVDGLVLDDHSDNVVTAFTVYVTCF